MDSHSIVEKNLFNHLKKVYENIHKNIWKNVSEFKRQHSKNAAEIPMIHEGTLTKAKW